MSRHLSPEKWKPSTPKPPKEWLSSAIAKELHTFCSQNAFTAGDTWQMRSDVGAALGSTAVEPRAKFELFRQLQIRLVEEMEQLRRGDLETVPA